MAGQGRLVTFHGAFKSKADAVRKETEVNKRMGGGTYIEERKLRGSTRYYVIHRKRGN